MDTPWNLNQTFGKETFHKRTIQRWFKKCLLSEYENNGNEGIHGGVWSTPLFA